MGKVSLWGRCIASGGLVSLLVLPACESGYVGQPSSNSYQSSVGSGEAALLSMLWGGIANTSPNPNIAGAAASASQGAALISQNAAQQEAAQTIAGGMRGAVREEYNKNTAINEPKDPNKITASAYSTEGMEVIMRNNSPKLKFRLIYWIDTNNDNTLNLGPEKLRENFNEYYGNNVRVFPLVNERYFYGCSLYYTIVDEEGNEVIKSTPSAEIKQDKPLGEEDTSWVFLATIRMPEYIKYLKESNQETKCKGIKRFMFNIRVVGETLPRESRSITIDFDRPSVE